MRRTNAEMKQSDPFSTNWLSFLTVKRANNYQAFSRCLSKWLCIDPQRKPDMAGT